MLIGFLVQGLTRVFEYTRLEVSYCLRIVFLQAKKIIDAFAGHLGLSAKFAVANAPDYVACIYARLHNDTVAKVSPA